MIKTPKYLIRNEYLNDLIAAKDKDIIKVVTGIRRCGKSTLFKIYIEYLKQLGVTDDQIIVINLEDIDFEFLDDYKKLHDYVKEKLIPNKKNYVFLDEVQTVDQFEKACDSLYIKENVDLYITGSNAHLLSGELATLLAGRYIEIKM
ncbi:MAG TPA: AAA family ATPase, partial [Mollicutes bacterium]|nr:AAA family ATPase [Mollicutes bacterium]